MSGRESYSLKHEEILDRELKDMQILIWSCAKEIMHFIKSSLWDLSQGRSSPRMERSSSYADLA